ncbi:non-ribosomal peptide synthetase module [Paenibacillus popilliae ATCC 14706]|uniref:Non-ribosomal peptide synthetase module n=1 Tax=Paenibacillus popilliae ATCC 14706 TaxID=1212764 RepID=M9L8F5_PAEPP|nr:non-ribosomal peptide synthetase module [Paenibacillus popilliae ATCC 14706]
MFDLLLTIQETYSADGRSFTIDKETVTTYVTVHEISATVDIEVVDKQTGQTLFEEGGVSVSQILPWLETSTEGKRKKRFVPAIPIVVAVLKNY